MGWGYTLVSDCFILSCLDVVLLSGTLITYQIPFDESEGSSFSGNYVKLNDSFLGSVSIRFPIFMVKVHVCGQILFYMIY